MDLIQRFGFGDGRSVGEYPSGLLGGRLGISTGVRMTCAVATFMMGAVQSARAEVILAYDATNSSTSAPAAAWIAGMTPKVLARGGGLTVGTGGTFNSGGWTSEPTDYLEWGWSASQALNLTDLDLRYDRSTSGPTTVSLALSVNGGAFQTIFDDNSVDVDGEDVLDINLSGFMNVTSATFRLFGGGASSAAGTFDLEPITGLSPARAIVVNGLVAVPEPSGAALIASACSGLFALRRRRRREHR